MFDGTNDTVRKGFCQLIVDKCYRAPNGRGYLVLQSLQDEKKVFQPACLSELSRMSLSVRKPNGELFNDSKDDAQIFKIEHESINNQYLKIITMKYFDKNEFFKGDNILLKGFAVTKLDPAMNSSAIAQLNEYINRPQGHEIVQMGEANDSGYYRNFYIKAPGAFDDSCGKYVVDTALVTALDQFNAQIDYANWNTPNGRLINTALQCIFMFKVEIEVPDAQSATASGMPLS